MNNTVQNKARDTKSMKKVGQFLIDMERNLGKGQYGSVYLAQEIPDQSHLKDDLSSNDKTKKGNISNQGSVGDTITKVQLGTNVSQISVGQSWKFFACKVVERSALCQTKESLIVSEINNQDACSSQYVVKMRKAIKTDSRYYIFMEYCNGSDLKEVMELKKHKLGPAVIQ